MTEEGTHMSIEEMRSDLEALRARFDSVRGRL